MTVSRAPDYPPRTIPQWVDSLQASGRYTFTTLEATAAVGGSQVAVASALRRLRAAGRITSPRRGFHVVIPLEYRTTGAPPASWFIDDLMRHLGQRYYVGLLSAAALHGAAHQAVQVFQVVSEAPLRPVRVGRVGVAFVQGRADQTPTLQVNTPTGTMSVSTPEGTAFDLVRHARSCGGLSNVATVLRELAERLDSAKLVMAAQGMEITVVQRTGLLLDLAGASSVAAPLATWLGKQHVFATPLRPDLAHIGANRDPRWGILMNTPIEFDE